MKGKKIQANSLIAEEIKSIDFHRKTSRWGPEQC